MLALIFLMVRTHVNDFYLKATPLRPAPLLRAPRRGTVLGVSWAGFGVGGLPLFRDGLWVVRGGEKKDYFFERGG